MINIWFTNADTLTRNKIIELTEEVKCDSPPDIIAINEVKPKNFKRVLNATEYQIPGYTFQHNSLDKNDHTRGVAVYIKESIKHSRFDLSRIVSTKEKLPNDIIAIEIDLVKKQKIIILNMYRSPNSDFRENNNINEFIKKIGMLKYKHIILVGDFNRRKINWNTVSSACEDETKFIEACQDSLLSQHVQTPTRGRGSNDPSLIDLFLTTNAENVGDVSVQSPLGKSDHSMIKVEYYSESEKVQSKTIANYEKADYQKMKNLLDINWVDILNSHCKDINGMWEAFFEKYKSAEQACVPKKVINMRARTFESTLDRKGRSKRKRKCRLWKRYLETKDENVYFDYCRCRNQVRMLTRKSAKNQEKKVATCVKTNNKLFWKHVNRKTKLREAVPDLYNGKRNPNEMTKNDSEKAEVLGNYFSSVFVKEPNWSWILNEQSHENNLKVEISKEAIKKKLQELNVNKSPGPDLMHPRVIKEISSVIIEPLHLIFNASLKLGKVPVAWKLASITPIYKKKRQ